jgi:hypothetical protein
LTVAELLTVRCVTSSRRAGTADPEPRISLAALGAPRGSLPGEAGDQVVGDGRVAITPCFIGPAAKRTVNSYETRE